MDRAICSRCSYFCAALLLVFLAPMSSPVWAQEYSGLVVVWGIDDYEQSSVPLPNSNFIAIAGGAHHCMALKDFGTIVAWGGNPWGQCDVPEPNLDFIAMSGHGDDCLGLKADGSLVAWGNNTYGQWNMTCPPGTDPSRGLDFRVDQEGGNHAEEALFR